MKMEQHNKTEQDFRDKLNQREIMPSANAWDRLDAMLTVAEEKKSKRGSGWLYIAASISGFLLIGTVFLSQTEEVVDKGRKNEVVFENQTQKPANSEEAIVTTVSDSGAIASTESPTNTKTNSKSNYHPSQHGELAQQSTPIISQKTITRAAGELAVGNPVEAINPIPEPQKMIASNPIIHQKTDQPSVKVDELLAAAQSNNANPKTSVKVNAKSLLSEVDQQVNLTFREKMLRRASEVAETVANRNNE